ncbi:hypothetical protein CUMW_244220 [Citrus unshiu]|nr:hypothetical protein CUMW_244220 [Citrus unshiu]
MSRRGGGGRRILAVTSRLRHPAPPNTSRGAGLSTLVEETEQKLTLAAPRLASTPPPRSSLAVRLPVRPGFGTVGRKCVVRANHFMVQLAEKDIHHYDVSITPWVTSKKINRQIISQLINLYRLTHLGGRIPAYDGMKSIYTAGPLPFQSKEFIIELPDSDPRPSSSTRPIRERQFRVVIRLASKPDLYTLQQFLGRRHFEAPYDVIQVLGVILSAASSEKHTVVGRSFFPTDHGPIGQLGDGVEYWRGYFQSLRLTQMGLSLNIDVSARSFYEPILVTEFVQNYCRNLSRPLSDQVRLKVKKELKGIKVVLTHLETSNSHRITGISSQPMSQLAFTDGSATSMSVIQYFRERYNIALQFTSLPALLAGSEARPIYLPMELSRIVAGQRYTQRLNERQVTALLQATCQRPREREDYIRMMARANAYNEDTLVNKEFGIQVADDLTSVDARILPAPMLKYHETGQEASVNPGFGQWNMINKKMFNGGRVEVWTCVNFSTRLNRDVPFQFCQGLVDMCNSKGMVFNPQPVIPISSSNPNQIEKALVDVHNRTTQQGKQLQLPDSRHDSRLRPPAPPFQRGTDRGSHYGSGAAPSSSHAASTSTAPAPSSPSISASAPSSSSVSTLVEETEQKLTLAAPAAATLPPSSSQAMRFPVRPGFGTVGKKCVVRANHFMVQLAERDIHHYDVSITPWVTSRKINRQIISQLINLYRLTDLGERIPAYDGMKSIYTAGPLPFESKEFIINLPDSDPRPSSSTRLRERQFRVVIRLASKPDLYTLQQFLRRRHFEAPYHVIQVLDVVLRAAPSEKHTVVGRSFFSTDLGPMGQLGDGVEYWRGYFLSLRPTQMGLSLNIDVSACSFYEPILVTEFVRNYCRDLSHPLSDQVRLKVKKALKGIKVVLTHREYNNSHKITGISSQPMSQLMFTDDSATRMSVIQYFHERYNIALQFTSLPALLAGSEARPIYLPMELSRIAAGQRYTKRLNERQVIALLRATCQRPREREENIRMMARTNAYNEDTLVNKEFGIQVADDLTSVDARILPAPMLKYHETGREASVNPGFGQWNMINKKMFNGGRVEVWTCVNFSTRLNRDVAFQFCQGLVDMCNSKGMVFNSRPVIPISSSNPNQIEKALVDVHNRTAQQGKQLQLLIIILPDVSGSYGRIKRVCETELGIVSQCCQPRQASRLNMQYFENVALKINVKVGGRNTVLVDAVQKRIPLVTDRPTIIFGANVTHPQPGEDSSPSIAAVVASMDWPEVAKYRGLVSAQAPHEEIIQDLYKSIQDPQGGLVHGGMIRELLIAFRRSTNFKPHRIIFYRDGVGERQFSQVLLHEMNAIRQACASLEEGYAPPVTFVVVQKRCRTRLFPAEHNRCDLTDRSGNILPGTVVDTEICHPTEFDFYLNSHAGIQGTSRPTRYHVLYDENRFTADGLQVLTNNLCYTYARCTRSVSVVPPAYYAYLAAFRARYYIEDETSAGGSTDGNRSTAERNLAIRPLPVIKDNVKDVIDQPAQAPAPSFQRGGGEAAGPPGRGHQGQPGGTGRGSHSGSGAAPSSSHAASTSTAQAPSSPSVSASAPSSSSVSTLVDETEQKLTLAAPAAATLPPSSSQAMRLPVRPGFGTVGRKCVVRANHFMVQLAERDIHHYDVFNPRPVIPISSSTPNQIEKALVDVHNRTTQQGKQLQLLIIILPDDKGSYGRIKRVCETELGIVSQCCQPKQASKLSMQYFENVALKINVKVGGRNTVLVDAVQKRIPLVTDRPTIIFGADVTHPQRGEDSSPSIAAVVASMDWPEVTKYRGLVSAQARHEEIIQDLYKSIQDPQRGLVHGGMIRELLIAFKRSTNRKPESIIFYRDGVSEGQFSQVLLHEMNAIRLACASLEEGYAPPVTFVVVQKRHHTRLFPAEHNRRDLTDRSGNILPGTVVDTQICHPTEFDFYLNSHAGIQGTSRPTHYHVLFDENRFSADGLQVLTNNLCYTYARCTRSVSIVPPAYYAHLAAFRARFYIEDETSAGGSTGGTRSTAEGSLAIRPLPAIKDNVKDVMFYC